MSLEGNIFKVIGGEVVAAVATIREGKPSVRYMSIIGLEDLTMIGTTRKASRKVEQIRENPDVALAIWSGKNFSDPYIMIQAKAEIHEGLETKKKYWYPVME